MAVVLKFPQNFELTELYQEYVRTSEGFKAKNILPFVERNYTRVEWDEKDNARGMTPPHNMDANASIRSRRGGKRRSYEPIPFKATEIIKESELLKAAQLGTMGNVVSIDELAMESFNTRKQEDAVRAEQVAWDALQGEIDINENGVKVHETFPIQEYTPTVPWDELATAAMLEDMNATSLMFRGTGATAQGAEFWMNQASFIKLLESKNPNDLRGFNVDNFRAGNFDITQLNKMMVARGLPVFMPYDEGYYPDEGDFRTFIPDGVGILIGKRPNNQKPGDFLLTPSLHKQMSNRPAPGFFAFMTVNGQGARGGSATVDLDALGSDDNPRIGVTSGFYGGPRIIFPRSIIKMNLFEAA
jgi:Phage major capsid protein E